MESEVFKTLTSEKLSEKLKKINQWLPLHQQITENVLGHKIIQPSLAFQTNYLFALIRRRGCEQRSLLRVDLTVMWDSDKEEMGNNCFSDSLSWEWVSVLLLSLTVGGKSRQLLVVRPRVSNTEIPLYRESSKSCSQLEGCGVPVNSMFCLTQSLTRPLPYNQLL